MKSSFFQRYLLPGFIFQSVVIGGGYSTGRELVEFFLSVGPLGGLLGMLVATIIWSVTLALSFELARVTKSYDYRSFFKILIGPAWFLFEIAYVMLTLVALAVLGAASGAIAAQALGWPPIIGTLGLLTAIGILTFYGSNIIERFMAGWSFVLYGAFIALVVWSFVSFGEQILANGAQYPVGEGWFVGGVSYSGYNVSAIAAVFFCLRHIATRREAVTAGLLAGPIAMLPGLFLFLPMIAFYPAISDQQVPLNFLVGQLGAPGFLALFQVIIFGTFIETGVGMIHSLNERVAQTIRSKGAAMPRWLRPAIAVGILSLATFVAAEIGLIDLISQGYGYLTWAFVAVFLVPLFLIGWWLIKKHAAD